MKGTQEERRSPPELYHRVLPCTLFGPALSDSLLLAAPCRAAVGHSDDTLTAEARNRRFDLTAGHMRRRCLGPRARYRLLPTPLYVCVTCY